MSSLCIIRLLAIIRLLVNIVDLVGCLYVHLKLMIPIELLYIHKNWETLYGISCSLLCLLIAIDCLAFLQRQSCLLQNPLHSQMCCTSLMFLTRFILLWRLVKYISFGEPNCRISSEFSMFLTLYAYHEWFLQWRMLMDHPIHSIRTGSRKIGSFLARFR